MSVQNMLQAGLIVAGWDKHEGGSVYAVPLGGTLVKTPFSIGLVSLSLHHCGMQRISEPVKSACLYAGSSLIIISCCIANMPIHKHAWTTSNKICVLIKRLSGLPAHRVSWPALVVQIVFSGRYTA